MTVTSALGLIIASLILSTVMQYVKKFKGWLDAQPPAVIQAVFLIITSLGMASLKLFGTALPPDLALWTSDHLLGFLASLLTWLLGMGWHALKKTLIDNV